MQSNINNLKKRIAIVSYDDNRGNLIEWSYFNRNKLCVHDIIANETTAEVLKGTLSVPVTSIPDRSPGGYHQLLNMINEDGIDILLCIGDSSQEKFMLTGIGELCALAIKKGIIVAGNESTANFIIGSLRNIGSQELETSHNKKSLKIRLFQHLSRKPLLTNFHRTLLTNKN